MEDCSALDGKLARLEDRELLRLSGPDARDFLQGLITNDITRLSETKSLYAALLTPQGKFLFDFFLIADGDDILIDTHAETAPALLKRLTMYKLRAQVTLAKDDSLGVWARLGPKGLEAHDLPNEAGAAKREGNMIAVADPRLAAMGARLIGPAPATTPDADRDDYQDWRLAMGVPAFSFDILPEKSFPLECNFEEMNGVDFKKGCYVGQEVTARTKHRGSLKKRLLAVRFEGTAPESETAITADGREIGAITSTGTRHAIALVRLDRWAEAKEAGHQSEIDGRPVSIHVPDWVQL